MPSAHQLPEDISHFAFLQAFAVRQDRFYDDTKALAEVIRKPRRRLVESNQVDLFEIQEREPTNNGMFGAFRETDGGQKPPAPLENRQYDDGVEVGENEVDDRIIADIARVLADGAPNIAADEAERRIYLISPPTFAR